MEVKVEAEAEAWGRRSRGGGRRGGGFHCGGNEGPGGGREGERGNQSRKNMEECDGGSAAA